MPAWAHAVPLFSAPVFPAPGVFVHSGFDWLAACERPRARPAAAVRKNAEAALGHRAKIRAVAGASKHIVRREDDLLLFVADGPIKETDLDALIVLGNQIAEVHAAYWVLADVRKLTDVDAAARRRAAKNPAVHLFAGAAVFGASLVARTLITLIVRGMAMLGQSHIQLRFFESEADARAWLTERRAKTTGPAKR